MPEQKMPKMPLLFSCKICDFSCSKKSNLDKHLMTLKHKNLQNPTNTYIKNAKIYNCDCGKIYKHSSTYYAHKNKCVIPEKDTDIISNNTSIDTTDSNLIVELLKQNQEFKELLIEQHNKLLDVCKNNSNTLISNSNVNSHNKTFNMNVFLNEHCKDAMNISEFVDSIQLGFNDLVNVGKVGYVEGISSIIINKLRSLDIHKRPMHCGDEKRHSMYIKEDGKWEKQPEDNNRVRRLIKQVAFKNTKNTVLFKEKYPDCGTGDSKYSDQYNKIVMESFGGRGASDEDKENKIVRMIAKEVYIDKTI